ncbi:hypothetical protein BDZ89DRAFT_1044213 [Hymenopellis radicata]|nr:hypothetical protein BDZ89DRAFT_1044213 [Hymenopellis radicata]
MHSCDPTFRHGDRNRPILFRVGVGGNYLRRIIVVLWSSLGVWLAVAVVHVTLVIIAEAVAWALRQRPSLSKLAVVVVVWDLSDKRNKRVSRRGTESDAMRVIFAGGMPTHFRRAVSGRKGAGKTWPVAPEKRSCGGPSTKLRCNFADIIFVLIYRWLFTGLITCIASVLVLVLVLEFRPLEVGDIEMNTLYVHNKLFSLNGRAVLRKGIAVEEQRSSTQKFPQVLACDIGSDSVASNLSERFDEDGNYSISVHQ